MEQEHHRLEIVADVAHALSVLPETHPTIMRIYNRDRAKFYAYAMSCPEKNSPVLYCGRAEHQIMGLRALGILSSQRDADISAMLRSADRKAYDAIIADARDGYPVELESYVAGYENVDALFAHAVVCFAVYCYQHVDYEKTPLTKQILEFLLFRKRDVAMRRKRERDENAIATMKAFLGFDRCNGISGLYHDSNDEVREALEPLVLMLDDSDIDSSVYTADTLIAPLDAAYVVGDTRKDTATKAFILLLARAIKRDRDFCLDMYREDKVVELETARAEHDKALRDADAKIGALIERIAKLESALRDAEKERDAARKEADAHAGDAEELAALRNAMYEANSDAEEPLDAEHTREIPDNIAVIGGHQAWARMLSEAAPVRVWPAGTTCPHRVIASASEVWIQAAHMSHSAFYAAIGAARRAGVPVRYFSSTGVARCVDDLRRIK